MEYVLFMNGIERVFYNPGEAMFAAELLAECENKKDAILESNNQMIRKEEFEKDNYLRFYQNSKVEFIIVYQKLK